MSRKQKHKIARQNGAKAAGAKTPKGIQASSQNSLKHGLLAKTLVLANESQTKFDSLMQSYVDRFQPADEVEMGLVNQMVAARWRQQRLWMIQTAAVDLEMDRMQQKIEETMLQCSEPTRISIAFTYMANKEKAMELLMRYETSYNRMHDRAIKSLQCLQKDRKSQEEQTQIDAPNVHECEASSTVEPALPITSDSHELEKQNLPNDPKQASLEPDRLLPETERVPPAPQLL